MSSQPTSRITSQEQTFSAGMSGSFKVLLGAVSLAVLGMLALLAPRMLRDFEQPLTSIDFWILVASVLLSVGVTLPLLFAKTRMHIHPGGVDIVTCGIFKKSLTYSEIQSVETGPVTGLMHGAGLRMMGGGQTGYLTGGPSVSFNLVNGTTVTVSCTDPDAALAAVRRMAGDQVVVQH